MDALRKAEELRILGSRPVQQVAQIVQERRVAEEVALDEVVEVAGVREALDKLQLANKPRVRGFGRPVFGGTRCLWLRLRGRLLRALLRFVVVGRQLRRIRDELVVRP